MTDRLLVEAVHRHRLCAKRAQTVQLVGASRGGDDAMTGGNEHWHKTPADGTRGSRDKNSHGLGARRSGLHES
jgi:hypothetical protein